MKNFILTAVMLMAATNLFAISKNSPPAAPSSLTAVASSTLQEVWLYWQDNSTNEKQFYIQRAPALTGPWATIGITNVPATVMQTKGTRAWRDPAVSFSTTYFYRVYASTSTGKKSAYSNIASVTTANGTGVTPDPVTPPVPLPLTNALTFADSLAASTAYSMWKYYYLDLPSSTASLTVKLTGLNGDADLYVRYNALPATNSFGCKSILYGTNPETCSLASPSSGRWYFGVLNAAVGTFSYSITATYTLTTATNCTFSLSQGSATMVDTGGTTNVTITTGCRWGMGALPSWVTASVPSTYLAGNGTTTVNFTVDTNTDSADRVAYVYFYDPFANSNPWSAYFRIFQAGSGCAIELFPGSRFIGAGGGQNWLGVQTALSVQLVITNADQLSIAGGGICPLIAFSDSSWLSLNSLTNGFTPMEISYIVEANATTNVRSGYVDVDGEIFAVHQSPYETNAPTTPVGLSSFALSSTAVYLSWTASTDDDRINFYRIYKDGVAVEESPTAYVTITGLTEGQTNLYRVQALDMNGNASALSTNRSAAPLPSSQRLVPTTFTESPPSYGAYKLPMELLGDVKIAFVRARFQDRITNSLVRQYYEERWLDLRYASAAAAWRDQSYGQVKLKGDVFDYFSLPINGTTNSQEIISALCDTMLAAGSDLERYDGYVLDVSLDIVQALRPAITRRGKTFWTVPMWEGYPAEHPAISRNGFSVRNNDAGRYAHNFGHYHQLAEGSGILLTNAMISTNASIQQSYAYANPYDPMGNGGNAAPHYMSREKEKCGWIKPILITASGSYAMNPYTNPASAVKAYKIPAGNQQGFIYVEYRVPEIILSYDNTTYDSAPFIMDGSPTNSDVFIDKLNSIYAAGLAVGGTFTDPWNGTTITASSTNSTSAVIAVTLGIGDLNPPAITITSPISGSSFQGAIPIYFTALDDKLLTSFELYEDGLLRGRYHNPGCINQNYVFPYPSQCSTNVSSWVYYRPSTVGSHVVTMKVWDTVNSATSVVTITATTDTTPLTETIAAPINGQAVSTNQVISITGTDKDIALMRLYKDNELVAFTHVGFVPYSYAYFVFHSLSAYTWFFLDSHFTFDDVTAIANGNVDQASRPKAPPHRLLWNTVGETEGEHVLSLQVEDFVGNVLTRTITVTVPTTL